MNRSVFLLPLLLAGLVLVAWWWPNRLQGGDVGMPAGRLNSVSFAPFRDGQSPLTDQFPSAAQVDQDLALLAPHVRAIRSYAALGGDYDLPAMAQAHGLKLWLGIWLGADRAQNAREIAAAIATANRHPETVDRVVVGNEVLLRRDLPPADLIAAIDQVRAAVKQPVTYVFTHDSIGVGEDGPTHQPIEQVALLHGAPKSYAPSPMSHFLHGAPKPKPCGPLSARRPKP